MKTDVAFFLLEVETEWGYEIESGDTLDIQRKRHGGNRMDRKSDNMD